MAGSGAPVRLHKGEIERLILVGAFDRFGLTQPESLWLLDDAFPAVRGAPEESAGLFAAAGPPEKRVPGVLGDYNLAQRCLNEHELLGYMLSGDLLEILDLHPASRGTVPMGDLERCAGRRVKVFGRQVTERIHGVEGTGEPMMFLTLEDRSGTADVILWPDVFQRSADAVLGGGPFEVRGRVEEDWGAISLVAERVRAVEWSPGLVDLELASRKLADSFGGEYRYADVGVAA